MNEMMQALTSVSAGAAGALFSAVWEGALLALAVYIGLRLIPGLSAAARSLVWLNVFILLGLLHFVPLFGSPAVTRATAPGALHFDPRWSLLLAGLWLVFSLARAVQFAAGAIHLRRLARRAVPIQPAPELESLLATSGGRRVRLCASDEVARPSVLGFFRPRILIPPELLSRLSPSELSQVVLHEMEHLRRGDDWTNLLQKLALVLFPLNPALAWVERRLCAERELACDDRVLGCGSGRKAYALCLAHLAEYSLMRRGFSLMLGAWERRPELVRRVHRILNEPGRLLSRKAAVAVTGSVVAAALGCALMLARAPQVVSFAPVPNATSASLPSPYAMARELGGWPELVKAVMPVPARGSATPVSARRPAHIPSHRANPSLLANLTKAPPPGIDTLVVMTEFGDAQFAPRMIITIVRAGPAPGTRIIPASYAVVPTPDGWLVIKI